MKRKTKNILCSLLIIILLSSIGFTVYLAKNNLSNTNNKTMDNNSMQEAPTKNDEENSSKNESSQSTPPAKPDGESTSNEENNGEEPPAKPDEDNTSSNESVPEKPTDDNTSNSDKKEPPTNSTNGSDNQEGMQMPNDMNMSMNSQSLTIGYYLAFGFESLFLSLIIIYLIQSKFNKLTLKETYLKKDKIIILILSTIISTSILIFGISYLTNNYFLNNNESIEKQEKNNTSSSVSYSASNEITSSKMVSNEEYTSTTADENALSVSGDIEVTLDNITVTKTGDSDGGDNTSFYGTNSAIIASSGASLNITNSNITTDATGANGVFSYGGSATTNNSSSDGTTINISDSTITTTKDNSGGIMTTGGGITNATNLTINTAGTSSAAIRTDRGGGTVNVDGGTYKTTGQGSPSIYSTAEITVKNATLIATSSEGVVIEGKNSVTLENVTLTDTNNKLNGNSTTYKNIFLYQSMSGDADDGISEFTSKDSTIITNKGDSFYITNTTAKITLTNNTITNNDSEGNFLRAKADSWGNSGSNGGIVTLVMNNQKATGNIVVDSISTLDMTMKSSSSYTGTINSANEAKSITLTLDKTSTITLTGNSYITSLNNADTTNSNINFNGYKLYVNGNSIN